MALTYRNIKGSNLTPAEVDANFTFLALTKSDIPAAQLLSDAATITWDYALGNIAKVTINANRLISITNPPAVGFGTLKVTDTGGGHSIALPGNIDGVTWNTAAGGVTLLGFQKDADGYIWFSNIATTAQTFGSESAAYFQKDALAGGSYSFSQKSAIDSFITQLKNDGNYAGIVEMGLMRGGTAARNALGFKNAYNLTFSPTGWTHSNAGSKPDGAPDNGGTRARTGLIPNTVLNIANVAISFYSGTSDGNGGDDFSATDNNADTANLRMIIKNNTSTNGYFDVGSGRVSITNQSDATGLFTVKRNGTTVTVYRNGVSIGSSSGAAGTLPTYELYLGANNTAGLNGGSQGTGNRSQNQCRFWAVSTSRTDAQETAFYNAIQTLLTAFNSAL